MKKIKLGKGFKELMRDENLKDFHKPLTVDSIFQILCDTYKNIPNKWTGIQHYEGFFGDGSPYEYWVVNGVMMGRGGYEAFLKSVKDFDSNLLSSDSFYSENSHSS